MKNVKELPEIVRFYLQPEEGGILNYLSDLPVRDFYGCHCLMAPFMVDMKNKNLQQFCETIHLIDAMNYKIEKSQEKGRDFLDESPIGHVFVDQVIEVKIQCGLNADKIEEKQKRFALLDLFEATCVKCPYKVPEQQK